MSASYASTSKTKATGLRATGVWTWRAADLAIVEPDDYLRLDMFKDMLALVDALGGAIDVVKTPWLELHEWDSPSTLYTKPGGLYRALPTSKAPFVLAGCAPILLEGHPSSRRRCTAALSWMSRAFGSIRILAPAWRTTRFWCKRFAVPARSRIWTRCSTAIAPTCPALRHRATEEKVALPFVRWMDMTSEMHDMGVRDEGIWLAHTVRAFGYALDGAIIDDGWGNPVVRRMTEGACST